MEKVDPPAGRKPCLLAESVKELREELRCYFSFSDEEVFIGMALLEEMFAILVEEGVPQSTDTTPASTPEGEAIVGATREPAMERRGPKFLGWEKVLHPSQPVVVARQIPRPSRGPRLREERVVWIP